MSLGFSTNVLPLKRGIDYTADYDYGMVGTKPELGDIVSMGIEPHEPYGRIIGLDKTKGGKIGTLIVQTFYGDITLCSMATTTGYCKKADWDGPVFNTLWHKE